jgi:saccharopine dehydrogenase (NAD+, L-lysine-forming)
MHTLCEQDFEPLERTWDKVFDYLEPYFDDQFKWLNLGGGHHVTRADYQRDALVQFLIDMAEDTGCQIYLEPGEAVALDAGILVGTILDILDCNGGDHGQAFATNFNPEINIREVTAAARHWEGGQFVESPALSKKVAFDFEAVGPKNMYMMYHEELESLAKFIPELERARFWMTFGDAYINHLTVLKNVGMIGIEPVVYQGREIVPLQFLASVLPKPETLGATTKGKTNIGDIATGEALDGSGDKTFYIYQICDHEEAYAETGNQAISYTTGVPAMIGAAMMLTGAWQGEGVFNIEQLDPDPFMDMLNAHGLPWQVKELAGPVAF